mgnify:CR=1 FL=1
MRCYLSRAEALKENEMDELAAMIPNGVEILTLLIAFAGLLSAVIPDGKMPPLLAKVLNFVALNIGRASNDPANQG